MADPMAQDECTRPEAALQPTARGNATPASNSSDYHVAAASTAADNMSAAQTLSHAEGTSTEHQALPYGNVAQATEAAEHQAAATTGRKRRFETEDASIEPPFKKQDSRHTAVPQGDRVAEHQANPTERPRRRIDFSDSIEPTNNKRQENGKFIVPMHWCCQCLTVHPRPDAQGTHHVRSWKANMDMHVAIQSGQCPRVNPWADFSLSPEPERRTKTGDTENWHPSNDIVEMCKTAIEKAPIEDAIRYTIAMIDREMGKPSTEESAPVTPKKRDSYAEAVEHNRQGMTFPMIGHKPIPMGPPRKKKKSSHQNQHRRPNPSARFTNSQPMLVQGAGSGRGVQPTPQTDQAPTRGASTTTPSGAPSPAVPEEARRTNPPN